MASGTLAQIFITQVKAAPMQARAEIQVRAGAGLQDDRYARQAGTFSTPPEKLGRHVTLIEQEAIDAVPREYQIPLAPGETRRNLITRGVALNHLVGREFRVGNVTLRGIKLCEPCGHLETLTRPGVMNALKHRGGLRADVLSDGVLRVGDPIILP